MPFSEQAQGTLHTNFHGTLNMCRAVLPILKPHARLGSEALSKILQCEIFVCVGGGWGWGRGV